MKIFITYNDVDGGGVYVRFNGFAKYIYNFEYGTLLAAKIYGCYLKALITGG